MIFNENIQANQTTSTENNYLYTLSQALNSAQLFTLLLRNLADTASFCTPTNMETLLFLVYSTRGN